LVGSALHLNHEASVASFDVIILGGGPAGYVCGIRAAQRCLGDADGVLRAVLGDQVAHIRECGRCHREACRAEPDEDDG